MMKTALVVFASVVGVLQAQRYPTPPPPPPKAFQGSSAARHRPAAAGGVLGVLQTTNQDNNEKSASSTTCDCKFACAAGTTCSSGTCEREQGFCQCVNGGNCIDKKMPNITALGFERPSSSCSWGCYGDIAGLTAACSMFIPFPPSFFICTFNWLAKSCRPCACSLIGKVTSTGEQYCNAVMNSGCPDCVIEISKAIVQCEPDEEVPLEYIKCAVKAAGKSCGKGCVCNAICAISKYEKICEQCQVETDDQVQTLPAKEDLTGYKSLSYPPVCLHNNLNVSINYEFHYRSFTCSHDQGSCQPGASCCHSRGICLLTRVSAHGTTSAITCSSYTSSPGTSYSSFTAAFDGSPTSCDIYRNTS